MLPDHEMITALMPTLFMQSLQSAHYYRLASHLRFGKDCCVHNFERSFRPRSVSNVEMRASKISRTQTPFIEIRDISSDGWKLTAAIEILRQGGLGIIPTDTCYMFVTSVHSRNGVERFVHRLQFECAIEMTFHSSIGYIL